MNSIPINNDTVRQQSVGWKDPILATPIYPRTAQNLSLISQRQVQKNIFHARFLLSFCHTRETASFRVNLNRGLCTHEGVISVFLAIHFEPLVFKIVTLFPKLYLYHLFGEYNSIV